MEQTVDKKNKNYKAINTKAAKDKSLSFKAKGLMFYLLSKPDGWRGHVYDMVGNSSNGKPSVQSALRELKEHGYVELITSRDSNTGMISKYYKVYDEPKKRRRP